MEKTLGGDRLGSGKKMKVDLHGYERSTQNLSYIWRSTMAAGTLVPFMSELALPGDTFDIDLDADIKTHPTIGPLFGSYKVQLDVFQCPMRLYNSLLHNNMLGIGLDMSKVKLPVITMYVPPKSTTELTDIDNSQINPSCLLSYIGLRGIGYNSSEEEARSRQFNAVPILAYWDIYKNYYANKQEEIGAVIHTPSVALVETVDVIQADFSTGTDAIPEAPAIGAGVIAYGDLIKILFTGAQPIPSQIIFSTSQGEYDGDHVAVNWTLTDVGLLIGQSSRTDCVLYNWRYRDDTDINTGEPSIATFPLSNIDDMRNQILKFQSISAPFEIGNTVPNLEPYKWLGEYSPGQPANIMSSQEGLALKTYQSDLFNNWLNSETLDGINGISEITSIDTTSGSFSIDTLRLANKVNNMLMRIAVSGGTYDDWLDTVFDETRYRRAESPMYMGGLSKELVFQEVVSNSASADQPLGTLAGRGVMTNKNKGGSVTIRVDEPSYIMGIISLTPRLDYSQGNKWDLGLQTLNDVHKPALDQIGFQDAICEKMAWWTTYWDAVSSEWVQRSAGKQPAWIDYMTNVNQTRGNFAISNNEMFMTLNRRYASELDGGGQLDIQDLTTYIDPSLYNFIFAETSLDSQNFWAQIAVDITARRKMSAKVMPNL